jgi:hypothetical protein
VPRSAGGSFFPFLLFLSDGAGIRSGGARRVGGIRVWPGGGGRPEGRESGTETTGGRYWMLMRAINFGPAVIAPRVSHAHRRGRKLTWFISDKRGAPDHDAHNHNTARFLFATG